MGEGIDPRRSPEYEDCRRLAEQNGVPLQEVYRAALSTKISESGE